MSRHINFVRAVGSEFVGRKVRSIALIVGIISVLIAALVLWLTSLSAWWWVLEAPIIILLLFGVVLYITTMTVVRLIRPDLTPEQHRDVKGFVDKLERVAESLHTPMFIIVFRVLRDIVWPRKKTYVESITEDGTTLHADFLKLQRKF